MADELWGGSRCRGEKVGQRVKWVQEEQAFARVILVSLPIPASLNEPAPREAEAADGYSHALRVGFEPW